MKWEEEGGMRRLKWELLLMVDRFDFEIGLNGCNELVERKSRQEG